MRQATIDIRHATPETSGKARHFWDHHHGISEDPFFWMALPLCRFAINRRISGDENRWPLEEFARAVGHRRFQNGLSLGCGIGNLERAVRRMGLCDRVTGIDFSQESVKVARTRARDERITGIEYEIGDLEDLRLPRETYDVVFIHQSLHHVRCIEKLIGRVARALTPDGYLFLEEWTGPSNNEWTPEELAHAARLYEEAPREWRLYDSLRPPIALDDPSEAVRSSAILPAVRLFFQVTERPYGGHLVPILLCQMRRSAETDPRFESFLAKWLRLEDEDLAMPSPRSYHTALAGHPYRGPRAAWGQILGFGRRCHSFVKYRRQAAWHLLCAIVARQRGRAA